MAKEEVKRLYKCDMVNKSNFMKYVFVVTIVSCFFLVKSHGQNQQVYYERFLNNFENGNYLLAGKTLDTLLTSDPKNNFWLIHKAEVEAKNNNLLSSISYLEKAIQNGYFNLDDIIRNRNLDNLHKIDSYIQVVKKLQQTLEKFIPDKKKQAFVIEVPPLMECYVIMLYLGNSNHPLVNKKQGHSYFKRIDSFFVKYKNHRLITELTKKYPGNPKEWINNLRAHHNIKSFYPFDSLDITLIKRMPIEIDQELLKMVQAFAVESNFMEFYAANQEYYRAMRKIMQTNYAFGTNLIPFFNSHFDMHINSFNVYFSPIYGGWQHGPTARLGDYIECFYFGGIMYTNTKEFYYPDVYLLFTFLTEFDHTTINPLVESNHQNLKKFNSKLTKLNNSGTVSYGNLESTIEEYLTWAFALHFFYEYNRSEYDNLEKNIVSSMEKNRGFARFGDFMKLYKTYMDNRTAYPKLKDFFHVIVKWLEDL